MKNILFIGHFKDASGYANAARGYLRILDKYLDKNKYNLNIFALNFEKSDYSEGLDKELINKYNLSPDKLLTYINNKNYTLIMCTLPNFCTIDNSELPLKKVLENKNCLKSINLVFWETSKVPNIWQEIYNKKIYDELIVCCEWNRQVFSEDTKLKTHLIYPHVYDYYESDKYTKNDKFTIFSMSQWQHRKGFDILLRAYYQEFFNQEDVELYIKTYRAETSRGSEETFEKNIIINQIKEYKESCRSYGQLPACKVNLQTGFCTKEEIKKLYQKSDIFCLPTRGEGFGLTIAQSVLSGIPCIVPDLGGHIDFLDKENNYFIKSSYEPPYNMPFHAYSCTDMKYVESSLSSTREQLRIAYNDWKSDKLKEKSLKAKTYTKHFLDEEKIFNSLENLLGK